MPQQPLGQQLRSRRDAIDQLVEEIQRPQPMGAPTATPPSMPVAAPVGQPGPGMGQEMMSPAAMAILERMAMEAEQPPVDTRDPRFPLTPALAERGVSPAMRGLQVQSAMGGRGGGGGY
jgi:hypothetical protein